MRACSGCGEVKPLTDYYRDRKDAHGRQSRCKLCHQARAREHVARVRAQAAGDAETTRQWEAERRRRSAEMADEDILRVRQEAGLA